MVVNARSRALLDYQKSSFSHSTALALFSHCITPLTGDGALCRPSQDRVSLSSYFPANRPQSKMAGDYVFISATEEDADEIIKLNTFFFAGTQLEIVESSQEAWNKATESKETQELRAKLQSILSQRYIGANKLLKLDSLASDAELLALDAFETPERAQQTFKGLMAICKGLFKTAAEKRDAIESITLANNAIDDVSQVESLATTFPQLKNLDLSNNQIVSMQALEKWRGKFKSLETIYMTGNPIMASGPNFASTLLQWFPKLQDVNGVQIRAMIAELSSRTSMVPQYSEMCLSQVDWNFDKALIVFEERKVSWLLNLFGRELNKKSDGAK